jgi:hypothetical protein
VFHELVTGSRTLQIVFKDALVLAVLQGPDGPLFFMSLLGQNSPICEVAAHEMKRRPGLRGVREFHGVDGRIAAMTRRKISDQS